MREDRKTIAFFPRTAYGPAFTSVAIAQAVRELGHRAVFITGPELEDTYAHFGFETFGLEHFHGTGLGEFSAAGSSSWASAWQQQVSLAEQVELELPEALHKAQPDLVCVDQVVLFPAIKRSGVPWVRLLSGAENAIPDPAVPPWLSGCGEADSDCADAFRQAHTEAIAPLHARFSNFLKSRGAGDYPEGQFLEPSPWLNLLVGPEPLRYARRNPLEFERYQFLDGCIRADEDYDVPAFIMNRDKPLLYLTLGQDGAGEIAFMKRLIAALGRLPYRVLVNIGQWAQQYDEAEVPPNVLIQSWFPQPSVVEQVDAVIHHGGGATMMECLYHAKPSLIMPGRWDTPDVAVRAQDTGHAMRLDRGSWSEEEMARRLDSLLHDHLLQDRLDRTARIMRAGDGRRKAAALLERLAQRSPIVAA